MSYLGYMVMNLGTSVPVSTCQIEQNRTIVPPGVLTGPSISLNDAVGVFRRPRDIERQMLHSKIRFQPLRIIRRIADAHAQSRFRAATFV